jgi:hypothetical protein
LLELFTVQLQYKSYLICRYSHGFNFFILWNLNRNQKEIKRYCTVAFKNMPLWPKPFFQFCINKRGVLCWCKIRFHMDKIKLSCGWDLAEGGWDLAECGWNLAEWMRSSRVVRLSDWHCSGIWWGAINEAVSNKILPQHSPKNWQKCLYGFDKIHLHLFQGYLPTAFFKLKVF